jgi:hypothetical protein
MILIFFKRLNIYNVKIILTYSANLNKTSQYHVKNHILTHTLNLNILTTPHYSLILNKTARLHEFNRDPDLVS